MASVSPVSCVSGWENLCLDNIDGNWWGVAIEILLLVYAFVGVAVVADRHLVVSLETLCVRWDVREDVAGASFMAFGSAAPEIVINAISTLKTVLSVVPSKHHNGGRDHEGWFEADGGDDAALGVGAILGSGMIAFTAIPGLCGVVAGADVPLELKRRPLARDVTAYMVSLGWLVYIFHDGEIKTYEAGAMLVGYGALHPHPARTQPPQPVHNRHARARAQGPTIWLAAHAPAACSCVHAGGRVRLGCAADVPHQVAGERRAALRVLRPLRLPTAIVPRACARRHRDARRLVPDAHAQRGAHAHARVRPARAHAFDLVKGRRTGLCHPDRHSEAPRAR